MYDMDAAGIIIIAVALDLDDLGGGGGGRRRAQGRRRRR
jgi:hypothetical protein